MMIPAASALSLFPRLQDTGRDCILLLKPYRFPVLIIIFFTQQKIPVSRVRNVHAEPPVLWLCEPNVVIHTPAGSYAAQWGASQDIPFVAE